MKKINVMELNTHVWLAGFVNIAGLLFQLYTLISTGTSEGLSLVMCVFFTYIQFVYGRLGQKEKNKPLMYCMYTSLFFQIIVIIYVIYLRQ